MNPFYIPPPSLLLNLLKAKITGSTKNSVLSTMTPAQQAALTPAARQALSVIPATNGQTSEGAQANYTRSAAPAWMGNTGSMTLSPTANDPTMKDVSVLHEGLHGVEWNLGLDKEWQKALSQISPETRAELIRRSNWGTGSETGYRPGQYSGSNLANEGHIIDPGEAFAYAGMYGYDNVPEELKPFFQKIFKKTTGPALPNPAKQARDNYNQNQKSQTNRSSQAT